MTREYTRRPDLYDLEHVGDTLPGEIEFYRNLAIASGGPVLELGFGTGRVGIEIARAGIEVVGLDGSQAMLAQARRKLEDEPADVQARVTLIEGRMESFDLARVFPLVYVPFRAFLHLGPQEEQRACLRHVRRHLTEDGRFAGNFFRPRPMMLEVVAEDRLDSITTDAHGRTCLRSYRSPACDTYEQRKDLIFHTRVYTPDGALEEDRVDFLELTYIHAREWRLLLEVEGMALETLHGGFQGQAPGGSTTEYVWVARRAVAPVHP